MTLVPWHLYLMASLYLFAGLNHFRKPKMYIKIIPKFFPNPGLLNIVSGMAEMSLAIALCIPFLTHYAAIGIILLLIAVFPANIYMLLNKKASFGLPKWLLLLRIPIQFILIYWAYYYTDFI